MNYVYRTIENRCEVLYHRFIVGLSGELQVRINRIPVCTIYLYRSENITLGEETHTDEEL